MQLITIEGRLGRDAVLKEGTNGRRFIAFTVAVNSKVRGAEKTTWYEVISFQENYFDWTKYLKKGSTVIATGDLDIAVQEGNDGISRLRASVNACRLDFPVSSSSGATQVTTETKVEETSEEPEPEVAKPAPKKKVAEKAPETQESAPESGEDDLPF